MEFGLNGLYGVWHWQCGIDVSTVLQQVVINFQRIRQVAPHRLPLTSYTAAASES